MEREKLIFSNLRFCVAMIGDAYHWIKRCGLGEGVMILLCVGFKFRALKCEELVGMFGSGILRPVAMWGNLLNELLYELTSKKGAYRVH